MTATWHMGPNVHGSMTIMATQPSSASAARLPGRISRVAASEVPFVWASTHS